MSQVLTDQQALAWRARELWKRDAEGARLASRDVIALLQHLRQVNPQLSPATMEDLCDALDHQLQQLDLLVEELRSFLIRNRRWSIKDYRLGKVPDLQLRSMAIRRAINVVSYVPSG